MSEQAAASTSDVLAVAGIAVEQQAVPGDADQIAHPEAVNAKPNQMAAHKAQREAEKAAARQKLEEQKAIAAQKRAAANASLAQRRADSKHKREIARVNKGFEKRHAEWAALNEEATAALSTAKSLQPMSAQYFDAPAQLIEQRAGKATYTSGSGGVSIPIGSIGGRSVRYRIGATKGHISHADPEDKVVDSGKVVVLTSGVNFIGSNQTRVSDFKKMVDLTAASGELRISVSNRQKPTRIKVPASQFSALILAVSIAQADAAATRDQLVKQLEGEAARIANEEPQLVS